ncbi:hypothetical protein ACH5RR_036159 [Cinchona calisaya]|uniref:RNase H type-1 domain-containing protein n=1 Tax=Cinchona calisaya TaxID=153742 RepID=A0ABD2Y4F3_9GENT
MGGSLGTGEGVSSVNELIKDGKWDREILEKESLNVDKKRILNIPLNLNQMKDRFYWAHSFDGNYNIKVGYNNGERFRNSERVEGPVKTEKHQKSGRNFKQGTGGCLRGRKLKIEQDYEDRKKYHREESREKTEVGWGAVARDSERKLPKVWTWLNQQRGDAIVHEALVIGQALAAAKEEGWMNIVMEYDFKSAVDIINQKAAQNLK